MEREELFREALNRAMEGAKRNHNHITEEQLKRIFKDQDIDQNKMQMIIDYLKNKNIVIGEVEESDEEDLEPEDRSFLQMYLDELRELPKRSQEEKQKTVLGAIAGEGEAKKQLIQDYLSEVVEMARLYTGQGISLEDLIGEGNIGLMMGVELLSCVDSEKDVEGHLGKMIMDAMDAAIAEGNANREFDEKVLQKIEVISQRARELSEDLRRPVSVEELADEMKIAQEEIIDALQMTGNAIEGIEGFQSGNK